MPFLLPLALGLRSLALAAALLLGVYVVGFAALSAWRRIGRARVAVPLALSAGSLLFGTSAWLLGTLVTTRAIVPAFFVLVLVSLRTARPALAAARRVARELARLARRERGLAFASAAVALLTLPQLLLPLCDSDGARYHVALPKLWLLEGRISFHPWDLVTAFPELAEMLYLVGLRLGGPDVPKLLHAGYFVATLATLVLLVHRTRRLRRAAFLAVLAWAASPVVLVPAGAGFVEHAATFHVAVAMLLLLERERAELVAIALAAAAATKLTAGPAVVALAAAALVRAPRGARLRTALVLAGIVGAAYAPYGIRNVIATGDPIYPAGHGLLGLPVPGVSPAWVRYASRYNEVTTGFLGLPWRTADIPGRRDEIVGLHHLAGLAALLLALRERRWRFLVPVVAAYLVLSLFYRPPARYAIPAWLALSALEAVVIAPLASRRWGLVILGALVPALLTSVPMMLTSFGPAPYLLGRESRVEFLRRALPGFRATELVARQPPGGRVMALDFPAPVYFDRPWVDEDVLSEPPLRLWLRETPSGDALLGRLQKMDVRWLLVTPGYGGGTRLSLLLVAEAPEKAAPLAQLRSRLRLVATVDGVDLYEVPRTRREDRPAGQE